MELRRNQAARVLIADDEAAILEAYASVLGGGEGSEQSALETELFGADETNTPDFDLCLCRKGDEAVDAVRDAIVAGSPFEVAFLDMRMPPGIDGVQAAERIRALDANINIVIVTGYSDVSVNEIAERVKPADKLLYCQKPLQASEVLQLARALSEKWRIEQLSHLLMDSVEQNTAAVVIMDTEGSIEYVNPTFTDMTGYERAEAIGQDMCLMQSDRNPKSVYSDIWDTLKADGTWRGELSSERRNGEAYWESVCVSPLKSRAGVTEHFLCIKDDISNRKEMEAKLEYQLNYDVVTGLPNRTLALDRLQEAVKRAKRAGQFVGVLMVDIDEFNKVVSSLGPGASDDVLRKIATRLRKAIRQTDTVLRVGLDTLARMGGDVFIVVLPDLIQAEDAELVAERLLDTMKLPFNMDGKKLFMTASAGITLFPNDGDDPENLLRNSAAATQRAKEAGRDTFTFFTPELNELARERLEIEAHLRRALSENDLHVMFQPIMSADGAHILAAEALVRCGDGKGGLIRPDKFIPLAERTGMINALGAHVLDVACRQCRQWRDQGADHMRVAVNVSPRQFYGGNLVPLIVQCLENYHLPSDAIDLEITEGLLLDDTAEVTRALRGISDLGVPLSIDDFGTGYSSLSALRRFPIDILKIDRSFVAKLPANREDVVLVDTIITMAHSLSFKLVAEGVETKEQQEFLAQRKCDYLQGYLFSKPVPAREFSNLLRKQKKIEPALI